MDQETADAIRTAVEAIAASAAVVEWLAKSSAVCLAMIVGWLWMRSFMLGKNQRSLICLAVVLVGAGSASAATPERVVVDGRVYAKEYRIRCVDEGGEHTDVVVYRGEPSKEWTNGSPYHYARLKFVSGGEGSIMHMVDYMQETGSGAVTQAELCGGWSVVLSSGVTAEILPVEGLAADCECVPPPCFRVTAGSEEMVFVLGEGGYFVDAKNGQRQVNRPVSGHSSGWSYKDFASGDGIEFALNAPPWEAGSASKWAEVGFEGAVVGECPPPPTAGSVHAVRFEVVGARGEVLVFTYSTAGGGWVAPGSPASLITWNASLMAWGGTVRGVAAVFADDPSECTPGTSAAWLGLGYRLRGCGGGGGDETGDSFEVVDADGVTRTFVYNVTKRFFVCESPYAAIMPEGSPTVNRWRISVQGRTAIFQGDPSSCANNVRWREIGWRLPACEQVEAAFPFTQRRFAVRKAGTLTWFNWDAGESRWVGRLGLDMIAYDPAAGDFVVSFAGEAFRVGPDPSTCAASADWGTHGYVVVGCEAEVVGEVLPDGNAGKPMGFPDRFFLSFPYGVGRADFVWVDRSGRWEGQPFGGWSGVPAYTVYSQRPVGASSARWQLRAGSGPAGSSFARDLPGVVDVRSFAEALALYGVLLNESHAVPPAGYPTSSVFRYAALEVDLNMTLTEGQNGRWWYSSPDSGGYTLQYEFSNLSRSGWFLYRGTRQQ